LSGRVTESILAVGSVRSIGASGTLRTGNIDDYWLGVARLAAAG